MGAHLNRDKYDEIAGDTIIWKVNVPELISVCKAQYLYLLNATEISRIDQFKCLAEKDRYIVARVALRIILSRYTNIKPEEILFQLSKNGKPELATGPHFNLSHSGSFVLIACSASPVGIDVEYYDNDFQYNDILDSCFSRLEQEVMLHSEDPLRSFLQSWTRKEALLKREGRGIEDDITEVSIADRPGLCNLHIDETHIAAIAFDEKYPIQDTRNFSLC
ncbi:MAG: 4'-phosphopantetheinyl transferase superfamily protein [Pedobacter sp.]|nr:MAG: 4'-phosphopantetheinyl transferase superfamily protein [Pedobacter sp.]